MQSIGLQKSLTGLRDWTELNWTNVTSCVLILTAGKGTNMRFYTLGRRFFLFFFYIFCFVLTPWNVYAVLFSLRAEREEFISNTKVKNWRLSCAHRLWQQCDCEQSAARSFSSGLWKALRKPTPSFCKGFPIEPGLLQALTWVRAREHIQLELGTGT